MSFTVGGGGVSFLGLSSAAGDGGVSFLGFSFTFEVSFTVGGGGVSFLGLSLTVGDGGVSFLGFSFTFENGGISFLGKLESRRRSSGTSSSRAETGRINASSSSEVLEVIVSTNPF